MTEAPAASEEPVPTDELAISEPAVSGVVVLPEGAVLPDGATWSVELQDTSKMDVPAETVGRDEGVVEDAVATEIPFVVNYDPEGIDERFTYTLSARIVDAEGNLLFINDTSTPGMVDGEPVVDAEVEVIDVQAAAAEAEALMAEAEESPEA